MAKTTTYMHEYYAYQVIQLKFLLAPKFEIREIHFLLCFKIWDVTNLPPLNKISSRDLRKVRNLREIGQLG
jgi:hypothetical protein